MPKMKTHRGAAKRLKQTGTGKLKRMRSNKSHILNKKTTSRLTEKQGTLFSEGTRRHFGSSVRHDPTNFIATVQESEEMDRGGGYWSKRPGEVYQVWRTDLETSLGNATEQHLFIQ